LVPHEPQRLAGLCYQCGAQSHLGTQNVLLLARTWCMCCCHHSAPQCLSRNGFARKPHRTDIGQYHKTYNGQARPHQTLHIILYPDLSSGEASCLGPHSRSLNILVDALLATRLRTACSSPALDPPYPVAQPIPIFPLVREKDTPPPVAVPILIVSAPHANDQGPPVCCRDAVPVCQRFATILWPKQSGTAVRTGRPNGEGGCPAINQLRRTAHVPVA
jgi:hypothetical protein